MGLQTSCAFWCSKFCHWTVLNHPNFCRLKFFHKFGSCPETPSDFTNYKSLGQTFQIIPFYQLQIYHPFLGFSNVLSMLRIIVSNYPYYCKLEIFIYIFILLVQITFINHRFFSHNCFCLHLTSFRPAIYNFMLTILITNFFNSDVIHPFINN